MLTRAANSAILVCAMLIGAQLGAVWAAGRANAAPESVTVGDFPVANDVRIAGDEKQTRFVVDLTRKIELRAFTLANPYRVVIDLPQVTFALPDKSGETGRGL